ncbi:hypothetical protein OC842_000056 [Tilletia horrida]|uniref:Uncharacterized protein n=1 Tax=Tilletia horrida TaxID=155126 RepID=A0AAN6GJX6_9BASI|nr:hypothetical protein OC842_000056 [Tilletia horrida]
MKTNRGPPYPTTLQVTGDIIFSRRDAEDGINLIRGHLFDANNDSILAHLISACPDEERDGWFTVRHMPAATCPFVLLDRGNEHARKVPEEVDGLTFMGPDKGWCRFDVRINFAEAEVEFPLPLQSLVNFDGILDRVDLGGIPLIRAHQLVPVGRADPDLKEILA